jgi:hypothetical protein
MGLHLGGNTEPIPCSIARSIAMRVRYSGAGIHVRRADTCDHVSQFRRDAGKDPRTTILPAGPGQGGKEGHLFNSVSPSVDVTVVIAAYNAASFIDRAITSVLEQQGCSLDIVVVDDASGDDTIGVVQRRAAQDPRLRLITLSQNSGPASARNAGFSAARGRWIAVLDADDAFVPGRLEHLVTTGDTLGLDIVADNFRLFDVHTGTFGAPALRESAEVFIVTPANFAEHARPFSPETDWGLLKPIFGQSMSQRQACDIKVACATAKTSKSFWTRCAKVGTTEFRESLATSTRIGVPAIVGPSSISPARFPRHVNGLLAPTKLEMKRSRRHCSDARRPWPR